MSDVFLLGAGFSKAISPFMPDLKELSNELKQSVELPPNIARLGNNVELWLTYLSQPHPWLTEAQNLRNKSLFLDMSQSIGNILSIDTRKVLSNSCPDWICTLVQFWHDQKSHVITLNYDTLIERAAGLIKVSPNSRLAPDMIYPVPLTLASRRDQAVFGSDNLESFKIYKFHGSVNWHYSGASTYFGETIYYNYVGEWGADESNEQRSIAAVLDKVPLIVPPTTEKITYFQHETLRSIWSLAGSALGNGTRLVCIGYSLPLTDLSMQFFLKDNSPADKIPLLIVNPDQKLGKHYQCLLGASYEIDQLFNGDGAVERFVESLN